MRAVSAGLRARKKEKTRDAIVAAAIELFERKGFDATTVEEIAAAADVSPRTFFRYFDSKVEVMMGPHEESDDFADRLRQQPPELKPLEAVIAQFRTLLDEMLEENPLFARQMRIMIGTPSLRAVAREHFHEHEVDMAAEFARRLDLPEDDLRPRVMAAALGNALWTATIRWVEEDAPPERLVELLDETSQLLAKGFD